MQNILRLKYMNYSAEKEQLAKKLYSGWNTQDETRVRQDMSTADSSETSDYNFYTKVSEIMDRSLEKPSISRSNDVFYFV